MFRRSRVAALVALALVGLVLALLFRLLGHPPHSLSLLAGLLPKEGVGALEDDGPAAFFLGFAGYGEERVFAEKIGLAARVIGERYDTEERAGEAIEDKLSSLTLP